MSAPVAACTLTHTPPSKNVKYLSISLPVLA
jgi:hypothetical protein